MSQPAPAPAELTDQEHAHVFTPAYLRRRTASTLKHHDPILAAKAERIAEIRDDDRPIGMAELENSRNRGLRQMMRRLHEMKPAELISAVEMLDGEIAAQRAAGGGSADEIKPTREEMLAKLSGSSTKEVQK